MGFGKNMFYVLYLGYISETKRFRRLIHVCTSVFNLDVTFDLAVVTLTLKPYMGYISETISCRKLILGRIFC